jgi:hypothetical protein
VLVSFAGDGPAPFSSLTADANGDLFGMTSDANGDGTVFEITASSAGYAGTATTLASFSGADGLDPIGNLVADASGDLFGATNYGGADSAGTVFEIAKTVTGYAGTPTTLVRRLARA